MATSIAAEQIAAPQTPGALKPAASKMRPYVRYLVFILTIMNVLNCMDRIAMSVLLPQIKLELHLSDKQLGLLVGLAFSLFYATCGIPVARLADRGFRARVMVWSLTVWSLMTAASGLAQNFGQLLLARMGLGCGEAGAMPASASLISEQVPYERRSGVFALTAFGGVLGTSIGIALAGWLGPLIGWRWTFVALGGPGLLLAVLVKFTVEEPPTSAPPTSAPPTSAPPAGVPVRRSSLAADLGWFWRCRSYRRICAFLVVNGFIVNSQQQWFASFYSRSHHLSPGQIGSGLALAAGLGSAVGLFGGGWITDRAAARSLRLPYILGAISLACALPLWLGVLFVPTARLSLICLGLASTLTTAPLGTAQATLYSVLPLRLRSLGGATLVFMTGVLGLGLGPLCIGYASDLFTPRLGGEALRYAMALPLLLYPLFIWSLLATRQHIAEDLAAVDRPEPLHA